MGDHAAAALRLGTRVFAPHEPAVMAIVNATPDSFYDNGATFQRDAALERVDRVVDEGAAIIDVGGVRAGAEGDFVDTAEEIRRTAGLIGEIHDRHPDVVVSIDTWRAPVARAACEAGATLVNDPWAGHDPQLAEVAAEFDAGLVCSHSGGLPPRTDPPAMHYDDVVADVTATVTGLAKHALSVGVRADRILIDPTHDFGKLTVHSLALTRHLDTLVETGWPVLIAVSRKDFIGETLDLPADDRLAGTLATTAVCAWHGARVVRAHDVRATRQVLDMVESIKGTRPPAVQRRGLA